MDTITETSSLFDQAMAIKDEARINLIREIHQRVKNNPKNAIPNWLAPAFSSREKVDKDQGIDNEDARHFSEDNPDDLGIFNTNQELFG